MSSTPQRPSIELQDRDFVILCGLFESRVMTLWHIASLFFDGKSEAAKKRVQKLKAAGYVREEPAGVGGATSGSKNDNPR